MKLSLVCFLFLFFLTPENAVAQANTSRPTSEQSLEELVREVINRTEASVEKGEKDPSELAQIKDELNIHKEREQRLASREVRLATDLEMERARLNELNDRLNAFELELAPNKP